VRILSLGWGVQSFTLAAMVALGELEPIDFAIHADTTHESLLTYQFAARWESWLEEHGVRVVTVNPDRADPTDNGYGQEDPPYYSLTNGEKGQGKRQCTSQWKITPMRRWISQELKDTHINKTPGAIQQLLGISLDEFQRMRTSDVQYIANVYPLVDLRMTRSDCINWLDRHGLEVPPKSACTFCPFHSTAEWRRIKQTPEDWAEALKVDEAIRNAHPPYVLFVHPARKPLADVDLRTAEEKGQLSLWDNECSGICGV
jgi:hypothetical protein